ncbi:hypothetical protein VNN36_12245 (plasmid) [Lactococcus garvieae]|uniref:hypothetical protein n=1 Tax=Lactococcus garvieae TaxID=1363 RepID=UPI0030D28FBD
MIKPSYEFFENNEKIEDPEDNILDMLSSAQKVVNEAKQYRESVISAAEEQASLIISQANELARQKEAEQLQIIEEKKRLKQQQVLDLKKRMLEMQEQIESLL